MKFSIAALSGLVGVISAAAVPASLPAAFTLVADGGKTVLTDGSHAWVGGDVTNTTEILILRSGSNGMVSFTGKDAVPTAFQNLYIVENSVSPVGLTVPHSAAIPENGSMNKFGVNEDGYFTHDGNAYFAIDGYGDAVSKELYWYGAHSSEYAACNLWVKECKGC
ncbi:hypothetical protein ASPWEDRAFT_169775 [Aspergillus wentii DTO 134E9]|uniref:Uncharacterized protein n=1 Tax=Aspergillus wentii DTO 134E9 TaxID=1073089 RepID=A0A1L9RYC9_ASPWE|nr:uncharacterized protein ASPWEDRAFT_169775 [Aspergillus wentii DTO 134E9]KAI9931382.1 hypothetical protein MW887_009957 [Aspergillus wentii]OJJ39951.1 hypothetical protein ASPWEDRAFT_169775 [Aspergillus wentii DTO 134E9]